MKTRLPFVPHSLGAEAVGFTPLRRSLVRPGGELERPPVSQPEMDAVMMHPGDHAHAFGRAVESPVSQKAPHETRAIVRPHVQEHETVGSMTEGCLEEILILREEGHPSLPMQQDKDLRILRSRASQLPPHLPERDVPLPQQRPLVFREVLVQQVQAAARAGVLGLRTGRRYGRSQASPASRTASATAASGIRPPQRVPQMKSQDRPSATSSNTCQTMMRVPLKVGWPWQMAGSATMYWPSSIRRFASRFMGRTCATSARVSSWFPSVAASVGRSSSRGGGR